MFLGQSLNGVLTFKLILYNYQKVRQHSSFNLEMIRVAFFFIIINSSPTHVNSKNVGFFLEETPPIQINFLGNSLRKKIEM